MMYYDLVLGLIPLTLFGFSGALYSAGVALTLAVPVGALVAAALVGHAMFVSPPVGAPGGDAPEPAPGSNATPGAD